MVMGTAERALGALVPAQDMPTNHLRTNNVLITWNNPDPQDVIKFKTKLDLGIPDLKFSKWCQEHWTGGGTPHMHGFLLFTEKKTWNPGFRENLGLNHATIEICKGSHKQAVEYIQKSGVYSKHHRDPAKRGKPHTPHKPEWDEKIIDDLSYGELPEEGQGHRRDLQQLHEAIAEGKSIRDIARDTVTGPSYIRYHAGIDKSVTHHQEPRSLTQMPRVLVAYGGTGTGKTRLSLACLTALNRPYYQMDTSQTGNNKSWFNGYYGEKSMAIEEFRGGLQFRQLLQLIDRYQFRAEIKQGFTQMQVDTFAISSPCHPSEWYNTSDMHNGNDRIAQLQRRLTENPESRIIDMDRKCFVDFQGQSLPYTLTPAWLEPSLKEIIPTWRSYCSPLLLTPSTTTQTSEL